jgi:hypothetical protein
VPVNHSVLFKWAIVFCTIFKGEYTVAMLEILMPISLILAPIGIVEGSLAMAQTVLPVAHVTVSEEFVVAARIQPNVGSKSMLKVVLPIANVSLVAVQPVHDAMTVTLIVLPVAFVVVVAGVGHLALAPFHASLPSTLVDGAILVLEFAVAASHALLPSACVLYTFLLVDIGALAMSQSILDIALVA